MLPPSQHIQWRRIDQTSNHILILEIHPSAIYAAVPANLKRPIPPDPDTSVVPKALTRLGSFFAIPIYNIEIPMKPHNR